ncbi:F-box/WD-40 repeat-containing protein [Auxenochlorella protothecoides]|uniref:F-box/WD-40 repeat-containing protein n=1 Tax=Auxenochlorella protothecoides TaxID=3075 RepID=A0A087SGE2_AUXPR|nr:F-box/WD-40 repeat-containing protein [Auxenochlorella protothecoides]KFM24796.1 F-box/WD-40 repeat-containing protein [Auxenochlorella protothecoides]
MVLVEGACAVRHIPSDTLLHILELLSSREACTAALVCRRWHRVVSSLSWASRYAELWHTQDPRVSPTWQLAFSARMAQARSLDLRCTRTSMHGHSKDIKCVAVLASSQLVYTGSYDGTLICWDLVTGTRVGPPLRHGGTVRAVSLDEGWLVSGCSDGCVSAWTQAGAGCATHYNLEQPPLALARHGGPVSSLQLSLDFVYSGSWDGSVLEVNRTSQTVCRSFYLGDWIVGIALMSGRLLVAAGNRVVSARLHAEPVLHGGPARESEEASEREEEEYAMTSTVTAILGCSPSTGSWAIIGDESGRLLALNVAAPPAAGSNPRVLVQALPGAARDAPITSLSWQFPWLLATSRCGAFLLETCEALGAGERSPHAPTPPTAASVRTLTSQPCRCAALGGAWVVAADGARGAVWDHATAAAAAAARSRSRALKRSLRDARRERAAGARGERLAAARRAAAEGASGPPCADERGMGAAAEQAVPCVCASAEAMPSSPTSEGVQGVAQARPLPCTDGTGGEAGGEEAGGEEAGGVRRPHAFRLAPPCGPHPRPGSCRAQAAARTGATRRALLQEAALHRDD